MKILIVEDDKELALVTRRGLEKYGFSCDVAFTGMEGEDKIFSNVYDTILMDLNLGDCDGLDVIKKIRDRGCLTPVIILSARDKIEDRISGLNLGSDDYLVKPFDLMELRARINVVVRRMYGRVVSEIKIGLLTIDSENRIISYDGCEIKLSVKEFDILEYIASNYPYFVTSENISKHVYDEYFDQYSSVLRVHIANLKKKLKLGSGVDILVSEKGSGYKICL